MSNQQRQLSQEQIQPFRRPFPEASKELVERFLKLLDPDSYAGKTVVDIGGGAGGFARLLADKAGCRVRVFDNDQPSLDLAAADGLETVCGDALAPRIAGDEGVVCFSLILHHLVGSSEKVTRELQRGALAAWQPHVNSVFIYEFCYESYVANLAGRLIFWITGSGTLSLIGRAISTFIPSLRANTFGVGVRFRSRAEWRAIFHEAGYRVKAEDLGTLGVAQVRRLLLIRGIARDCFVLEPS